VISVTRLRLNRPQLVQQRMSRRFKTPDTPSPQRYAELLNVVDELLRQKKHEGEDCEAALRAKADALGEWLNSR
jgi:hypothetical protein